MSVDHGHKEQNLFFPVSAPSYAILFPIIIIDPRTLDDAAEVMHEISDQPEQTSRVL